MSVWAGRTPLVRTGVRIEIFTFLLMIVEAAASPGAEALARSAMLAAFAIDRVIELVNGAIMLWKLSIEAQVHCLIRHLP